MTSRERRELADEIQRIATDLENIIDEFLLAPYALEEVAKATRKLTRISKELL